MLVSPDRLRLPPALPPVLDLSLMMGICELRIGFSPSSKRHFFLNPAQRDVASGSNRARFGFNVLGLMKIISENLSALREPVDQA